METFFVSKVSCTTFAQIMRDKILEKSGEMFLTLGFKSVTMDDIARELGISKKTLYKYFSNKANLVAAATGAVQQAIDKTILNIKDMELK